MIKYLDKQDKKELLRKIVIFTILLIFVVSYYYFMYLKLIIFQGDTISKILNLDLLPKTILLVANLSPFIIFFVLLKIIFILMKGLFKNKAEVISGTINEKKYTGIFVKHPTLVIEDKVYHIPKKAFDLCNLNDKVCLRYINNTRTFIRMC